MEKGNANEQAQVKPEGSKGIPAVEQSTKQTEAAMPPALDDVMDIFSGLGGVDINGLKTDFEKAREKDSSIKPPEKKEDLPPAEDIDPLSKSVEILSEEKEGEKEDKKEGSPEKEAPTKNKLTISSPLLGGEEEVGTKKSIEALNIEGLDGVNSHLKDNFGFESYTDLTEKLPDLIKSKEILQEKITEQENLLGAISKLPQELLQAIEIYEKNGDDSWREPIMNAPRVDFSKPAEDYDKKEIIDAFFPGEISADDWENYNGDKEDQDPTLKRLINNLHAQGVNKFKEFKYSRENRHKAQAEKDKEFERNYNNSLSLGVDNLKKVFPKATEGYVNTLVSEIKNGGIEKLYFDKNGHPTPDAIISYAMARDGKDLNQQQQRIIKEQAESEANEDILTRTPDKPKSKGGESNDNNQVSDEFKNFMNETVGGLQQGNFY